MCFLVRGASQLSAAVNFHLVRRFADLEKTQCSDKDPPLCQPHHLHSHHSHLLSHFSKIQTGQNLSLAIHEIYLPQVTHFMYILRQKSFPFQCIEEISFEKDFKPSMQKPSH
ncbi:hypothetical protein TNIN_404141 [Trichonephila inaurata madagascariensis]|uniref:Uncharacterized protein n=1 Tax=Trichonephila inaurata madagascariensis TaxID=2747483 RepID=A0A8X6M9E8_9ARAC|nr:hypothetical protein TNIN_404141 [Trichonephila inaurata madagascariensis]